MATMGNSLSSKRNPTVVYLTCIHIFSTLLSKYIQVTRKVAKIIISYQEERDL